jgi:hypothetical protein
VSEEKKIIEYLKDKGFTNSVIGSVQIPAYSKIGDPYAMRNVSVTVAYAMAEYFNNSNTELGKVAKPILPNTDEHGGVNKYIKKGNEKYQKLVDKLLENFEREGKEEVLIKIEDFHIGFEYEEYVLCHHGSRYLNNDGFEWKRRVYDFNSPKLLKIKKQIENGLVRHCSAKKDGV